MALDDHCVARAIAPHFFSVAGIVSTQMVHSNICQNVDWTLANQAAATAYILPQPTLQLSRRTNHAFRRIDQGQVSFPWPMKCKMPFCMSPKALGETSWAHLWLAQQLQVVRPPYHAHIIVPSLLLHKPRKPKVEGGTGGLSCVHKLGVVWCGTSCLFFNINMSRHPGWQSFNGTSPWWKHILTFDACKPLLSCDCVYHYVHHYACTPTHQSCPKRVLSRGRLAPTALVAYQDLPQPLSIQWCRVPLLFLEYIFCPAHAQPLPCSILLYLFNPF